MKGFAAYGGLSSQASSGKFTSGSSDGDTFQIKGSGISGGGDFQLPLSDNFSLNFILMSSSESASSSQVKVTNTGHGMLGVEGRLWFDTVFAGLHVANYSEVVLDNESGGSKASSGAGLGLGVTAGWQKPDSGFFVMGQYDSANLTFSNAKAHLLGFRAQAGYRWKMGT
jgi:hypothetical protein